MTQVIRALLTPKWLGALVLAVLFAIGCYFLGGWQYGRHVDKVERNARLDANYAAPARPVAEVIGPEALPLAAQWTHVEATGTYAATAHLYVRNRPNRGVYGYEVVAPLRLGDGSLVLVDRGWVANAKEGASILPVVPPVPTGQVRVTGWALPGEPSLGRSLPEGQLASINLPEAAAQWGESLRGGYLRLEQEVEESGALVPAPAPLDPPDRSLGPHQAYAFQWWLTMPLGFVLVWYGIRRERQALAEPGGSPAAPSALRPARQVKPAKPAKPKKVRIWDEEDG